jgi:hypothetical protein
MDQKHGNPQGDPTIESKYRHKYQRIDEVFNSVPLSTMASVISPIYDPRKCVLLQLLYLLHTEYCLI